MNLRFVATTALRSLRGMKARAAMLVLSVAASSLAIVLVGSLAGRLDRGLSEHARAFLGGDLALEARRSFEDVDLHLRPSERRGGRVDMRVISTMARSDAGASHLVEVKALAIKRGDYPLSGKLVLVPPRPVRELLRDDTALVAPGVLSLLGLEVGDRLHVGEVALRIAGVVEAEPDPLSFSLSFGPRVIVTDAALARSGLTSRVHRVRVRTVLTFPAGEDATAIALRLRKRMPGAASFLRVETSAEGQPALRSILTRVRGVLGLAALLSLVLGASGVAQLSRVWLADVRADTAVLRCLGASLTEVSALFLGQLVLLTLLGALLGAGLGVGLSELALAALPELDVFASARVLLGEVLWATGLTCAVVIAASAPSLYALGLVSPMEVFRFAAARPPRRMRIAFALASLVTCFGAASAVTHDLTTAVLFALLVSLTTLTSRALFGSLRRGLATLGPRLSWPVLARGISAVARPQMGTTSGMVLLVLGLGAVETLALLAHGVTRDLRAALPERAPSTFLVDIQPSQWDGVRDEVRRAGAEGLESVPVVMARLISVAGRPVQDLLRATGRDLNAQGSRVRALTRENRITYRGDLPPDNVLVEGALFRDPHPREVSLERDFARDLGAELGDTLRFEISGVPIDFLVTSLRTVRFQTLALNFFIVAEPGSLADAPFFRVASFRLPATAERALQNTLAAAYPNVAVVRVEALFDQIRTLSLRAVQALSWLLSLTLVTAVVVLAATLSASHARRAREVALLKALGVTRPRIALLFGTEFALLGLIAGALASLLALALSGLALAFILDAALLPSLALAGLFTLAAVCLVLGTALAASGRALSARPASLLG